jgi:hypothetical protein
VLADNVVRKTGQLKQTVPKRAPVPAAPSLPRVRGSTYYRGEGWQIRYVCACGAEGDLGICWANDGNRTPHDANVGPCWASPMDWTVIVSPVAWYAIRVLEFIEYIERFSAKPRMIGRVCWHHARTCLPNCGNQMQNDANGSECGVTWGKTNRLGGNNIADGSGFSSL